MEACKIRLVEGTIRRIESADFPAHSGIRFPQNPWVTGLKSDWKLRGLNQKYILRKLAERVGVPKEVLHRPKRGFALPLVHWMRHELKDLIVTVLMEPRTMQRGYFDPKAIRIMLDEHFAGRRDHSGRIWRLLMLELWHRNFLEPHAVRRDSEMISAGLHSVQ